MLRLAPLAAAVLRVTYDELYAQLHATLEAVVVELPAATVSEGERPRGGR